MKKLICAIALLMSIIMILSSCKTSNGNTGDTTENSGTSSGSTDVTSVGDGDYKGAVKLTEWLMRDDAGDVGVKNGWEKKYSTLGWDKVTFPGSFEYSRYNWFSAKFKADLSVNNGDRVLVRFAGMPYYTQYWMNGVYLGDHTGRVDAFTFDVTDCIKPGEDNHIAIRCNNPDSENDIDGLINTNIGISFSSNPRVQEPVYVFVKPAVYAEDAVVYTDCEKGAVNVEITVNNTKGTAEEVVLAGRITENGKSDVLSYTRKTVTAEPGVSTHTVTVPLSDFRYWSPEDPFLYDGAFTVESKNGSTDTLSKRVAFRTFKVNDKGYFELNGKPYYLKASFSGNRVEMSFENGSHAEYYYQILTYLKSCGINTIRALDTVQIPELLDMCDKVGMLVYSEHPMAWHKVDDAEGRVAELFKESVIATLKTVRSHPSVVLFGFQNETDVVTSGKDKTSDQYEVIKTGPSWARDYAKDIVFMLSSGRFDGNLQLGSASNPGSYTWDGYMGNEGADKSDALIEKHISNTYSRDMGDIHYYPLQPYGYSVYEAYKKLDTYSKGVLISEAGTGALYDIFAVTASRTINGRPIGTIYPNQIDEFRVYFDQYGLDRIFASPEAVIRASNRLCGEQRARLLTYIRSVGKINGYITTGIVDAGGLGEGLVNEYGKIKEGVTEAVTEGLSDLRFCVVTDSLTYYKGETVKLTLTLSDLKFELDRDQQYTASLNIRGENGTVWHKNYKFKPSADSFGTDIATENIVVDFPAGDYTINVEFVSGGLADCTDYSLTVFDSKNLTSVKGKAVYGYALSADTKSFLASRGAAVKDYTPGMSVSSSSVILVGNVNLTDDQVSQLVKLAENGCHVVFLYKQSYLSGTNVRSQLGITGRSAKYNNWLYHDEYVIYDNKITKGLQNRCLMDTLYYASVYSPEYIYMATAPDDVSVGAISLGGNDVGKDFEFHGGYQLATYNKGKGCITLNCLNIEKGIGEPVADTILCNLVAYSK